MSYLGRYAPSPTGDLHLGNALAAVCAWARARRAGGRCLLRIEDLDTPRVVMGATARMLEDLARLGLAFDGETLVQSQDCHRYHDALERLRAAGLVYGCRCSRRDLLRAASAPHEGDDGPAYPGTCRALALPLDDPSLPVAWRFRLVPGPSSVVVIDDALQGTFTQDVAAAVGDFIVKRKDGLFAYQLAVVVDDALQGISEVVRGRDLLSSAPRQALLFRALGAPTPRFAHLPLWLDGEGHRIAKRSQGAPHLLRKLFATNETPQQILGRIGAVLGVCRAGASLSAAELADLLDDAVLRRETVT